MSNSHAECACQPAPGYGPCTCGGRRATTAVSNADIRDVFRDLIGTYGNEITHLRGRVVDLLEANNREVFRRRAGDALLRQAAALFREYESHHRAKASEAGRPEKAERNAAVAGQIEAFLNGEWA